MKKLLALCVLALIVPVTGGCNPGDSHPSPESEPYPPPTQTPARPRGPIYTDPAETIIIDIGDTFVIGLDVVLRLGAKWQVTHDEAMLAVLSDDYYADDPESPGLGGTQYFHLRALRAGTTQVEFSLKHGATGPAGEQKIFDVQITGIPAKEPPEPAAWWPAPVTEGTLIEMHTRTTLSGMASHLTISADGEVIYIEETGLRRPTEENPPIRTTRTGRLTEAELSSLLETVAACPFDAGGKYDAFTQIIDTDAATELSIYYQGKTRVITADYHPLYHPFGPESPELMDVPESILKLYRELRDIIDNRKVQTAEEAMKDWE